MLDSLEVKFPCPGCGFENTVRVQDVRLERRIVCAGCHVNIQLEDKENSFANADKQISELFKGLSRTININIKS
jgi:predicted RNA-binding Zn-ribbon protein involved in translation (DUF1610 family)